MIRLTAKRPVTPIGLDLGSHSFKAAQLLPAAGGKQDVLAISIPRSKPGAALTPEEILRLQGVLDRRGFVGREVVLAVPPDALSSSILELPTRTPGLPMEQLAAAEFARVSKLDTAAVSLSCWDLPPSVRSNRATYMMAVGASTPRLDALVDLVEVGTLSVVAIDDPSSAVARGALFGRDEVKGLHTVIDLGWDAIRLSLVHGATLSYTRKFSEAALSKLLGAAVDATGEDAADLLRAIWENGVGTSAANNAGLTDLVRGHFSPLLKEIAQTLSYAQHQYPDAPSNGLVLCGGGATLPGLPEHVAGTLSTKVSVGSSTGASAMMALAIGLCLREDWA
jgi:Tfp pilus assembly PilM family ATPase